MKEIQVGDVLFKVKDYLPYMDLDKLNLYGLYSTQISIQKYQDLLPKKKDGETQDAFVARMTTELEKKITTIPQEALDGLLKASESMKKFDREIDTLLIVSPKLGECRPTIIMKLKVTPEYQIIRDAVQEDLTAIMNPKEGSQGAISKKV